jgi:hypothetical protein
VSTVYSSRGKDGGGLRKGSGTTCLDAEYGLLVTNHKPYLFHPACLGG